MKPRRDIKGGKTGNISIGGAVNRSALLTGNQSKVALTSSESKNLVDVNREAISALGEIGGALRKLSGPGSVPARQAAEAAASAAADNPTDKNSVGSLLEIALNFAKKTTEFISIGASLAPHLKIVVGWLGDEWGHLLSVL
ncbi:hypothetical protein [Rhizobium ruizarguesonis]|uniref:hypothetical protein n=1 Tax=Rhizobium ruizarguesonis TaxID=2081791 RepID=UPI0010303905|nr:hypothetical protein [Rhizobium ruizarguesonis]TBE08594.1 hypothetical protein ELH12_22305 [Rhizobium ruizarguesonis]TBE79907.1 hypothetical protein ELH01_23040 [Rhizobium ruizarguesonis]TBE89472.1 hypothetical protein ELG99_22660 [Rhizobium ruizarguesonis]